MPKEIKVIAGDTVTLSDPETGDYGRGGDYLAIGVCAGGEIMISPRLAVPARRVIAVNGVPVDE